MTGTRRVAGGSYGKYGSYRWTKANHLWPRTVSSHRSAERTVSVPALSGIAKAAVVSVPPRRSP
jgi:hypothetical protein